MGTFLDLVTVLLIFFSVTCIVYPELLHKLLFGGDKYNPEYSPYYTVVGIILGLTTVYLTYPTIKN